MQIYAQANIYSKYAQYMQTCAKISGNMQLYHDAQNIHEICHCIDINVQNMHLHKYADICKKCAKHMHKYAQICINYMQNMDKVTVLHRLQRVKCAKCMLKT